MYGYIGMEGAVYGALIGYVEEADALGIVEGTDDLDEAVEVVNFAFGVVGVLLIGEIVFAMAEVYLYFLEWPLFALGIHAHSHGSAGTEGGGDEFVGAGAEVVAAYTGGFIGGKAVVAHHDLGSESCLCIEADGNVFFVW